MNTEEKLRELVNYAIHHLSCGYTSNDERVLALQHLKRGLHNIEAAEQPLEPDVAHCLCGGEYYTDKVQGVICCRCQAPRR